MADLLITNIGELATPTGTTARRGADQGCWELRHDVCVACENGNIVYVGPPDGAPPADRVLDAEGALVTPGLVDAHTHLTFGGWRQHELRRKLEGETYLDILKSGGGILSTVRSTRAASEDELVDRALDILHEMQAHGTTTVEAKSGYGLSLEQERKQLLATQRLRDLIEMDIVSTFMGAHAIPDEYQENRASYIDLVCEEMIPAIAAEDLAEYCDVFCEAAVFSAEEAERILRTASEHNLGLKIHADEIESIGGSKLAARLGATSAEHLIVATGDSIVAMAEAGVVAVLLPATSFYLDKPYAPAREMLEQGMAVAVASDFNPGSSPSCNLQLAMNLACLKYRLTPRETLCAVTLNAAAALELAERLGSVEVGKQADLVLWNASDLDYIFYRYGSNLARRVVKRGCLLP